MQNGSALFTAFISETHHCTIDQSRGSGGGEGGGVGSECGSEGGGQNGGEIAVAVSLAGCAGQGVGERG